MQEPGDSTPPRSPRGQKRKAIPDDPPDVKRQKTDNDQDKDDTPNDDLLEVIILYIYSRSFCSRFLKLTSNFQENDFKTRSLLTQMLDTSNKKSRFFVCL